MKTIGATPTPAPLCIDTTLLRFANHLRGIPQVLFMIMDILSEPVFKDRVRFLAFQDVAEKHLLPRGILPKDIAIVPEVPLLGRWERFYSLFSTWRYRNAVRGAAALIHPEAPTITRLDLPQIVLWYDFVQLSKEWKPWKKPTRYLLTYYRYRLAMSRAAGITISEYTRREALRIFPGTDPAKLKTLWLGIRNQLKPDHEPAALPLSLPLRCMYVGAFEKRKNIYSLLENLGDVFGDIPFHLELAGKISPVEKTTAEEIIARSEYRSSIRLRGLVTDVELLELAKNSNVTLFPSLSEGFGLPVAEAMMHGHVVFAFNNTSIPEVGGDAIVVAEDNDFAAWGRKLRSLLENPDVCMDLRRDAMKRAEIFSEANMKSRYRDYMLDLLGIGQG